MCNWRHLFSLAFLSNFSEDRDVDTFYLSTNKLKLDRFTNKGDLKNNWVEKTANTNKYT